MAYPVVLGVCKKCRGHNNKFMCFFNINSGINILYIFLLFLNKLLVALQRTKLRGQILGYPFSAVGNLKTEFLKSSVE
jgi:hypothetical protein